MLIYLDFDGVLHPDEVYVVKGKIVLKSEGALFMWADRKRLARPPLLRA